MSAINKSSLLNSGTGNNTAQIHATAIVEEGAKIGKGTRIWHFCHIMPDVEIGENCNIGQNVVMMPGVRVGNGVKIQNNVSLYTGVILDDEVFVGPSAVFTNVMNPRSAIVRKHEYQRTHVCRGATIGANATMICGTEIGSFAFVGAGAVVTRDVPAYALVMGNPAKQAGWMSEYGQRLHFDSEGKADCPESGQKYFLDSKGVTRIS